jgi:general secretion pathway protein M
MISSRQLFEYFSRYPSLPALGYGGVILLLVLIALVAVINVAQRHSRVVEAADLLARLEHRAPISARGGPRASSADPQGSPFLQGQTVTIASAALLQRVTAAITHAGGTVVSSEVQPNEGHAPDGFVRISTTCDIEPKALRGLLYDIEAGMPFLFIDQLLAQAPERANGNGRLRVVLAVSGMWPGGR